MHLCVVTYKHTWLLGQVKYINSTFKIIQLNKRKPLHEKHTGGCSPEFPDCHTALGKKKVNTHRGVAA